MRPFPHLIIISTCLFSSSLSSSSSSSSSYSSPSTSHPSTRIVLHNFTLHTKQLRNFLIIKKQTTRVVRQHDETKMSQRPCSLLFFCFSLFLHLLLRKQQKTNATDYVFRRIHIFFCNQFDFEKLRWQRKVVDVAQPITFIIAFDF